MVLASDPPAKVAPACQRLLDAARAVLPALADEGVDAADLDAAQTAINVYRPLVAAAGAGIAGAGVQGTP